MLILITISQTQQILWIKTLRPYFPWSITHDHTIDSQNNIIVVTFPHLRKYSPDGEIIWNREINFGEPNAAIDVDAGDSIIVGGYGGPTYNDTWVIMKYAPDGESLWIQRMGFPSDTVPYFSDIAVDNQNNILVTGGEWHTYKLSPTGSIKWIRRFSSNWAYDLSRGVCADDSLNIIVSGIRGIYPIRRSWYPQVYKYSPTGDSLWAICYFDSIHYNYSVDEPTTDKMGNVILPGSEKVTHPPGNPYAFLFKYNPQGNYLWKWFDDSTASSIFRSCVTDTAGNIYVSGVKWLPSDTVGTEIKKFSPSGELLWEFFYSLGLWNNNEYYGCKIDIDQLGDLIVSTNKDTLVYIMKITERSGILEELRKKIIPNKAFPTIFSINYSYKINLPFDVNSIEIYDKSGKLLKKNKSGNILLNKDEECKSFSQGIYFIKASNKGKTLIKKIVLLK